MINEVCAYLHNWFDRDNFERFYGRYHGTYNIVDGGVELPFLREGQYYRIVGSIFNDGVHLYPSDDLTDEEFVGEVYAMAVPKDLRELVTEMTERRAKGEDVAMYESESFGGYSYTKAKDANGRPVSLMGAYASRLARWKKI